MEHNSELRISLMRAARKIQKVNVNVLLDGVSQGEYFALEGIWNYMRAHEKEKGIYVSDLAKLLNIASSAVSRMLHLLEEKELVAREVDCHDRRNTYVYLTDKGICVRTAVTEQWRKLFDRMVLKMGSEDMLRMIELWERLSDIMEDEIQKIANDSRSDSCNRKG